MENFKLSRPYKGSEPYIFISYSHLDKPSVHGLISCLQGAGYRVWYDEGIDPGTEWDDNIAKHIVSCGYFVALISKNYLDSENCTDELSFARDRKKRRLLIYLEEVLLPDGIAMRCGRLQAIHRYKYGQVRAFLEKFEETDGVELCLEQAAPAERLFAEEAGSYDGSDPYLYVSFAAKDRPQARSFIDRLQKMGCRVCYNEGAEFQTSEGRSPAQQIAGCALFLPLITENYLCSTAGQRELECALSQNVQTFTVFLENLPQTTGAQFCMARRTGISKNAYPTDEQFYRALLKSAELARCKYQFKG